MCGIQKTSFPADGCNIPQQVEDMAPHRNQHDTGPNPHPLMVSSARIQQHRCFNSLQTAILHDEEKRRVPESRLRIVYPIGQSSSELVLDEDSSSSIRIVDGDIGPHVAMPRPAHGAPGCELGEKNPGQRRGPEQCPTRDIE